ncbi:MAG TPA: hypothetical protein PK467_10470 [Candidatus Wallbacteria bacterium]|nr:hypothetical protein [Candidatus Wallbacteria bacterium]
MRKKIFVLLITVAMMSYCFTALSQQQGALKPDPAPDRIATVDLAAVFAMHPLMRYHDEKTGLFIKPFKKDATIEELHKAVQERNSAFLKMKEANSAEIERIKSEIAQAESEMKTLSGRKSVETASLSDRYEQEIKNAADEDARKALIAKRTSGFLEIEEKFHKQIQAQTAKRDELKASLDKIYRSMTSAYYLSPEETTAMFKNISAEIKDAVNFVAAKKGVLSVINISRMKNEPAFEAKKHPAGAVRDSREFETALEAGPDYTKIEIFLKAPEKKSESSSEAEKKYEDSKASMQKTAEINEYKSAYENRFKIIPMKELEHIMNANIVYGGCDITEAVIVYVFYKNGIPREKAETVCDALQEIEDID